MMTKERSMKIVNDPRGRVLVQGHGHKSYSENALPSTLSIYGTLITIVLRDYNAAFLCHS